MVADAGSRALPRQGTLDRVADWLLNWGLLVALGAMLIFFSLASEHFLAPRNLLNIGEAMAVTGIIAAGMTIALIAGQIDLSVGAAIGLTATVLALLIERAHLPLFPALLLVFGLAIAIGLLNGSLVVDFGINSIIATLALSTVLRGIAYITVTGQTLPITDTALQMAVNSRPGGIPFPLILMAIVYIAAFILLNYMKFGWHIYASGGNAEAARRSGINVSRLFRIVFIISASMAVLGGIITTGRNASGAAVFGTGAELDILTAVLLGGIGLAGGGGRVERTLIGVLFIGVLNNGLILMNVPSYYQFVARGGAFLLAVILQSMRAKRLSQ